MKQKLIKLQKENDKTKIIDFNTSQKWTKLIENQ